MKALLRALPKINTELNTVIGLFAELTLEDLAFYVTDVDATKYMQDRNYPIAQQAFLLENALNQCHYNTQFQSEEKKWKCDAQNDIIGCSTLYADENVTLCWFVIPPKKVLPLHDHPAMSVWQRVMFGNVHVTSFDWIDSESEARIKPVIKNGKSVSTLETAEEEFKRVREHQKELLELAQIRSQQGGEAKVTFADEVCGKNRLERVTEVSHFSPFDNGCLHEIVNIDDTKPALFIDLISPPYCHTPNNIPCTYFTAHKLDAVDIQNEVEHATKTHNDSGLYDVFQKGEIARMQPRPEYKGPAMDAFVSIGKESKKM